MIWASDARERVERSKREILDDIAKGVVPSDVASFSELHDYVDANEYGGLCEEGATDGPVEEFIALGRIVQDEVDAWLKAGRA